MAKKAVDELVELIEPSKPKKASKPNNKQKPNKANQPKKKGQPNMKKVVILTIASTIAVAALFVLTFTAGVNHQKRSEANINARIEAALKESNVISRDTELK